MLALGNFAPGDPVLADKHFHTHPHYLRNPWSAETITRLAGRGDVLILGSGLTALDLLFHCDPPNTTAAFTSFRDAAFSRNRIARASPAYPPFLDPAALPGTLRETMRLIRREVRTSDGSPADVGAE